MRLCSIDCCVTASCLFLHPTCVLVVRGDLFDAFAAMHVGQTRECAIVWPVRWPPGPQMFESMCRKSCDPGLEDYMSSMESVRPLVQRAKGDLQHPTTSIPKDAGAVSVKQRHGRPGF